MADEGNLDAEKASGDSLQPRHKRCRIAKIVGGIVVCLLASIAIVVLVHHFSKSGSTDSNKDLKEKFAGNGTSNSTEKNETSVASILNIDVNSTISTPLETTTGMIENIPPFQNESQRVFATNKPFNENKTSENDVPETYSAVLTTTHPFAEDVAKLSDRTSVIFEDNSSMKDDDNGISTRNSSSMLDTTVATQEFDENETSNSTEGNRAKNETTFLNVDGKSMTLASLETTTKMMENFIPFENASQSFFAANKNISERISQIDPIKGESPDSTTIQTTDATAKSTESAATSKLTTTTNSTTATTTTIKSITTTRSVLTNTPTVTRPAIPSNTTAKNSLAEKGNSKAANTSTNSINNPNITKTNDARAQSTPTTKVNITKGSTLTTESLSTTASSINGNTTVVRPPTTVSNLEISIRLITTSPTATAHSSDTSEQSAEMKSSITNGKNQNEIAKTTKLEFARNGTSNSNKINTVKNETTTISGVKDDNSTILTTVETTTIKIGNSNSFENASQPPLATHKV